MVKRETTKIIAGSYPNLVTSIKEAKTSGVVPIIAEVKRITPKLTGEKGEKDLRDAGVLAKLYQKGGAIGISLVAEKEYFAGQPEIDIPRILMSVNLPLLIKDFITNEENIDYYASLVSSVGKKLLSRVSLLLIAHKLENRLQRLISYVQQKGMLAQVEIRGEEDLRFLRNLDSMPRSVGINNKKIDELEKGEDKIVLNKSLVELYREVIGASLLISSSAHRSREDVRISIKAGADAVLVGTAFMQTIDPVQKVKEFVNAFSEKEENE